jgi:branched-chain amino acid transport system substrate-binding protein
MDHFWVALRPTRRLLSVLATSALLLALAGCSFFGSSGGSTGVRRLVIATLFAVSGADATTQLPAQYAVDLAVSQAHLPDGYTLGVVHEDYEGASGVDPTLADTEVTSLVKNPSVVGIVGPFNSRIAAAAMPLTNAAGLTMISPTTTYPGLTLEQYPSVSALPWSRLHPVGHPNRFFRTIANDAEQGQLAAYVASHVLGARTAFVTDDNTTYGVTLANSFAHAFAGTTGERVVSFTPFPGDMFSVSPLVDSILALHPDLVFYGGVTSGGGAALKKALVDAGYTKPLLGGDAIANDPAWLTTAGFGAANTYGTVAAPDVSALISKQAKRFVSAYETYYVAHPPLMAIPTPSDGSQLLSQIPTPYSVMAYDATDTLIAALSQAIEQGAGRSLSYLRAQTGADLASVSFHYAGLTGEITFDRNGDNGGQRIFSVYEVRSAAGSTLQWLSFQLYQCSGAATLSCHTLSHL